MDHRTISDIRTNLEFLRQNYGIDDETGAYKLKNFLFPFDPSLTNHFSVVDPDFIHTVNEIKEAIGYGGRFYTFSDYIVGSDRGPENELERFFGDVERILERVFPQPNPEDNS